MRAPSLAILSTLALLAGAAPALAQDGLSPNALNATNERLANQNQIRGIQQQQQFQNNQTQMQIQRNEVFRQGSSGPGIIAPRR